MFKSCMYQKYFIGIIILSLYLLYQMCRFYRLLIMGSIKESITKFQYFCIVDPFFIVAYVIKIAYFCH
jgi:hypothetical protein